jgi:O-antigen/teichoic acid export membrane protein
VSDEAAAPIEPRAITLARSSFWIAFDAVTSTVGSLVVSVAVARALGPEKLGHYAYIMWIANTARLIGASALSVGVRKYAGEFLGRGEPAAARALIREAFRWQAVMAFAIVSLSLVLGLSLVRPEHRPFTTLALLSLLPSLLLGVSAGAIEATQDFASNVQSSIAANLTNLVGTLSALAAGWELTGLAAALLASRVVDSSFRYLAYRRVYARIDEGGQRAHLDRETKRRILSFGWQVTLLAAINAVLWDRSEFFFLERFRDVRELAFYSLSFGLAQQILTIPQVFASAAGANLFVQQGRDPASLGRVAAVVVRYVALAAFPLIWGVAALSPSAIGLLYGPAYAPAVPVLVILALGVTPVAFVHSAQHLLMATEHQSFLLRWTIAVAGINVALDLALIPEGGAIGAAVGNVVSQALAVSGMWYYIYRRLHFHPPTSALSRTALAAAPGAGLAALSALFLPPVAAALVGTTLGATVFLTLLRWGQVLEPVDRDHLLKLRPLLPSWARSLYSSIVNWAIA